MSTGWRTLPFPDALEEVSAGNLKTPQSEFKKAGKYAVVDQGKDLVAGYVDAEERLCRASLPVIVFGDHTKCFKFVDFPFCMGADGVKVLRPKGNSDTKYLYHYLRTLRLTDGGYDRHFKYLKRSEVVLPPLSEQKRIATILDKAEELRAKRRAALAGFDTLVQSIFLEMFGDPATNPKGWPTLQLQEVLTLPLRNGLSPAKAGKLTARVLTLSAITGTSFDEAAWKTSTFYSTPPADQAVNEADFLICRGNGNVHLVGKGHFPPCSMPDVTFPDTMIAARVSAKHVERAFMQHVWNSAAVRHQLESSARTTNGTFKVNQTMLEQTSFIAPPPALQRAFGSRVGAVDKVKIAHRASLGEMDALFASLQHRTFRGELS